jgi:hypothetical protein
MYQGDSLSLCWLQSYKVTKYFESFSAEERRESKKEPSSKKE